MKTKVEINGYEISIEEMDGNITVKALKDGESVEEFTLGSESESDIYNQPTGDETQVKGFSEFGGEEHDFQSTEDEMESEISDEPLAFGEEPDYTGEEPDYAGEEESEHDEMESEHEEEEHDDEMESEDEDEDEEMESEEGEEGEEGQSEPEVKESLRTFESFIQYSKKTTKLRKK